MTKRIVTTLFLTIFATGAVCAADITVPTLELVTRGYLDSGSVTLATRGRMDFLIAGGYKFGGQVALEFESDDLEDPTMTESIGFKGATIVMRNLFGAPLDLAYFTGESDTFGAGDLFPTYFGSIPIAIRRVTTVSTRSAGPV